MAAYLRARRGPWTNKLFEFKLHGQLPSIIKVLVDGPPWISLQFALFGLGCGSDGRPPARRAAIAETPDDSRGESELFDNSFPRLLPYFH